MSYHLTLLGIVSALAVLIPGVVLLAFMLPRLKIPVLRNLTVLLAAFGILHGLYHLLIMIGQVGVANITDLVTVILLVILGVYYSKKVG